MMNMLLAVLVVASCVLQTATGEPKIYFEEKFSENWRTRWVESTFKGSDQGKFGWSAGKFFGDLDKDKGLQTTEDLKFYGISAKFDRPFSNDGKTLVIQFSVKHEQSLDCGGGYVKLFASGLDQDQMHGETPYLIMFGPDICGLSNKKVHVIFNYNGKNHLTKKTIRCKDDVLTHLYTLIVRPDNTYEVKIDNEKVESGSIETDWDLLEPKKIKDPNVEKPSGWDDREKIDDPNDKKPEDWDKPEFIPDPTATRPEDWDDEIDGEWEPAQMKNPKYKGDWKPKKISNPEFKGVWVHPEIDNPSYVPNPFLYRYTDIGAIGFDLWQVKSGSIFDNVLVTDDEKYAEEFGLETWGEMKDIEKANKEAYEEEQKLKQQELAKKQAEEEEADEGEEEEEEEEEFDIEDGQLHDAGEL